MHRNVFESELSKQLTPSLKQDEAIVRVFQAVDKELQEIAHRQQLLYLIANIDNLPEKIIRLLAWQWHVDFWDETLPLEKKRELVKNSIAWHRHKGTPWAVEQVVTAAYGNCILKEWFEYGGEPYFFRVAVTLEEESADKNLWKNVIGAINSVKNTRSWLEEMKVYYPDVILPIPIHHRTSIQQFVDARHCFWNLGNVERARWDGEFPADGTIRGTGIRPDSKYQERQYHTVAMQTYTDAKQRQRWYNIADGSVVADGSHIANGSRMRGLVEHAVTFSVVKNNIESGAIPL